MKILYQFVMLIFYYNVKPRKLDKPKIIQQIYYNFMHSKKKKKMASKTVKVEQTKTTVAKLL